MRGEDEKLESSNVWWEFPAKMTGSSSPKYMSSQRES